MSASLRHCITVFSQQCSKYYDHGKGKKGMSGLVCVLRDLLTLTSLHTSPSGQGFASSFVHRMSSTVWLCSVDSVTYECNDISESFPPPAALSLLYLFSFSPPIASSGLYKLAMSTESETLALTWPPGGNASPNTRRVYSQSSVSDLCKSVHFGPGIRFYFTGPLMVIDDY